MITFFSFLLSVRTKHTVDKIVTKGEYIRIVNNTFDMICKLRNETLKLGTICLYCTGMMRLN